MKFYHSAWFLCVCLNAVFLPMFFFAGVPRSVVESAVFALMSMVCTIVAVQVGVTYVGILMEIEKIVGIPIHRNSYAEVSRWIVAILLTSIVGGILITYFAWVPCSTVGASMIATSTVMLILFTASMMIMRRSLSMLKRLDRLELEYIRKYLRNKYGVDENKQKVCNDG